MVIPPYRGAGVLAPYNEKLHLFAILNDPCGEGKCAMVMVTTIYGNKRHDPSCILNSGDHPFIRHPSYLLYRSADIRDAWRISNFLVTKYYHKKEPFSEEVLTKIIEGLYQSDETKRYVFNYAANIGI